MALTQKEINDTIDVLNTQRAVLSQSDIDTLVQSLRDDGLDVVEENGNFVIKTTPAPLPPASGTEQQILQQ